MTATDPDYGRKQRYLKRVLSENRHRWRDVIFKVFGDGSVNVVPRGNEYPPPPKGWVTIWLPEHEDAPRHAKFNLHR